MFKSTVYKVNPPMQPGEVREISFDILGNPEDIIHIKPGCGCTANCEVKGNTLVATYTDTIGPPIKKSDNWKSSYPTGMVPFSKKITVFLKDDKPLYVHQNGSKLYNNSKKHIELTIVGEVKLS